jgi:cytochrome P450
VVETTAGETLTIPRGTHVLLDVWHANRHEDHWGVGVTGHPAREFVPERWAGMEAEGRGSNERLHFGFGHGPRFCPGKSLGQLEVALVVGVCVKLFRLEAPHLENAARAGVSTKPGDGVLVDLRLREPSARGDGDQTPQPSVSPAAGIDRAGCPFANRPPVV